MAHEHEKAIGLDTVTLRMREYVAAIDFGSTTRDSMELSAHEEPLTRHRIGTFKVSVLSDKIVDDQYTKAYTYKVFSSWFQHFKHEYAPQWIIDRFPVRYSTKHGSVTTRFTRYAEYPKANVKLRDNDYLYTVVLGGHERIYDNIESMQDDVDI